MRQKWLRMAYDDNGWQTLHNIAFYDSIRSVMVNGDNLWSRISSMMELVHIKSELRNLGQVYQVIPYMVIPVLTNFCKFSHI